MMVEISPWIWIGLLLLAGAAIGGFAVELVRRKWANEDERLAEVLEIVDWILDSVAKRAKEQMREIPLDEVGGAARSIYRQCIAGTVLANVMSETAFVDVVVDRWERMLDVKAKAVMAMDLHVEMVGPGGSLA